MSRFLIFSSVSLDASLSPLRLMNKNLNEFKTVQVQVLLLGLMVDFFALLFPQSFPRLRWMDRNDK